MISGTLRDFQGLPPTARPRGLFSGDGRGVSGSSWGSRVSGTPRSWDSKPHGAWAWTGLDAQVRGAGAGEFRFKQISESQTRKGALRPSKTMRS